MNKCIIAVFDLDGTLTRKRSLEQSFINFLLKNWKVKPQNIVRATYFSLCNMPKGVSTAIKKNKMYLRGVQITQVESWCNEFVKSHGNQLIAPDKLRLVKSHKEAGHKTILITGTLNMLIQALKLNIYFESILATELEVKNNIYTGHIKGIHYYGKAKADSIKNLSQVSQINLDKSYCYADSISDIAMMSLFGYPVAVSPDKNLLKVATQNGWSILK